MTRLACTFLAGVAVLLLFLMAFTAVMWRDWFPRKSRLPPIPPQVPFVQFPNLADVVRMEVQRNEERPAAWHEIAKADLPLFVSALQTNQVWLRPEDVFCVRFAPETHVFRMTDAFGVTWQFSGYAGMAEFTTLNVNGATPAGAFGRYLMKPADPGACAAAVARACGR